MIKVMRGNTHGRDREQANMDIYNETELSKRKRNIYKYCYIDFIDGKCSKFELLKCFKREFIFFNLLNDPSIQFNE